MKRAFYEADRQIAAEAAEGRYGLARMMERHYALQAEVLGDGVRAAAPGLVAAWCAMTEEGWRCSREVLARLHGHLHLGVVSNFYGNLDTLLDESGLAPFLDIVVESARVGAEKPGPRIYEVALERLGLAAEQVVMVGDNFARDVVPAKRLGLRTVWLRRGHAQPPEPGLADAAIERLADLERALAGFR